MKPGGRVRGPGLPGPTAWRPVRNDALLSQWSGAPGLRQWQGNPPKALVRQFQVVRVRSTPYAAPAQPLGHGAGGTRADEGVQHQPARRTTGQDAGFHQCFGEGGVMGSRVILGSDGLHLRPHRDRGENGRRGLFPGRPTPDLPAAGEGGKHHTVPAHHNAIEYVEDSLDAAGLWTTPQSSPFPVSRSVPPTVERPAASGGQRPPDDQTAGGPGCRRPPAATPSAPPALPTIWKTEWLWRRPGRWRPTSPPRPLGSTITQGIKFPWTRSSGFAFDPGTF